MSTFSMRTNGGQPFYSPNKFESEQKDLVISQLKAENFELRQNERDYQELAQHLKSLEHRYNVLYDEKVRNEVDFKNKNDYNLKNTASLRQELDGLKTSTTEKHIESQELRAESMAVKDIADHRANDIVRLKNELQQLSENNRRIYEENLKFQQEIQQIREEKRRILGDQDILNGNYEDLIEKLQERDHILNQLSEEKERQEIQNQQLKIELDNIDIDLKSKNDNLRYTRLQYQEAQNYISQLQIDLEDIHKQKEKCKSDCSVYQKKFQQESDNCNDLSTQIMGLEQAHKQQLNIYQSQRNLEKANMELKNDNQNLKRFQSESREELEELTRDHEIYRRNFELLSSTNQELTDELERFHNQEEQLATQRSSKLKELRGKLQMVQKQTTQDILYQQQSPKKSIKHKRFD